MCDIVAHNAANPRLMHNLRVALCVAVEGVGAVPVNLSGRERRVSRGHRDNPAATATASTCLLYTSDAADE